MLHNAKADSNAVEERFQGYRKGIMSTIDNQMEGAPRPSYLKAEIQRDVREEAEKAMRARIEGAVQEAMGSTDVKVTQDIIAQGIEAAEARVESRIKDTTNTIGTHFEHLLREARMGDGYNGGQAYNGGTGSDRTWQLGEPERHAAGKDPGEYN